jgi:cobalt-zinc-cadmium efflux system membrane fusion protein
LFRFANPHRTAKGFALATLLVAAIGVGYWQWSALRGWFLAFFSPPPAAEAPAAVAKLVAGRNDAVQLPLDGAERTGIETASVCPSSEGIAIELAGTLIFDDSRLSHVHARFPGEIVSWGSDTRVSSVSLGEKVRAGQLLAVIWSRDLGEKKSELVDALSQLHVDQESLLHLKQSAAEGAIPDRTLRDAQRKVESDQIAVDRVLRTLEMWRVAAEEIESLRAEARRFSEQGPAAHREATQRWARLEVRSSVDGIILERNAAIGDLSRLKVIANAYEEDLPALDGLSPAARRWLAQVASDPAARSQAGSFGQIGHIIDPNQHTALVMGWVDNPDGRLRAGQFITARIELPAPSREVVIPATALVEEGNRSIVFVQIAERPPRYERRLVATSRRDGDRVFVHSVLTAELKNCGCQPLRVGERMQRYGITLQQLENAITSSNANVGGQYVIQGKRCRWCAAWASSATARTPSSTPWE